MRYTPEALLAEVPLFAGLERLELELIAECAADVRFREGARLFRRGDPATSFYVIRHGSIALETFVPTRGSVMIETLEPGEVVGWSWLFPPHRWHLDGRALSEVQAIGFNAACVREQIASDPGLASHLMSRFAQVLIERLQWTRLRLIDVYGDDHRA